MFTLPTNYRRGTVNNGCLMPSANSATAVPSQYSDGWHDYTDGKNQLRFHLSKLLYLSISIIYILHCNNIDY